MNSLEGPYILSDEAARNLNMISAARGDHSPVMTLHALIHEEMVRTSALVRKEALFKSRRRAVRQGKDPKKVRREELIRMGLCINHASHPAEPGKQMCRKCLERAREYVRASRARKAAN